MNTDPALVPIDTMRIKDLNTQQMKLKESRNLGPGRIKS